MTIVMMINSKDIGIHLLPHGKCVFLFSLHYAIIIVPSKTSAIQQIHDISVY